MGKSGITQHVGKVHVLRGKGALTGNTFLRLQRITLDPHPDEILDVGASEAIRDALEGDVDIPIPNDGRRRTAWNYAVTHWFASLTRPTKEEYSFRVHIYLTRDGELHRFSDCPTNHSECPCYLEWGEFRRHLDCFDQVHGPDKHSKNHTRLRRIRAQSCTSTESRASDDSGYANYSQV